MIIQRISKPHILADLFNAFVFDGKQVIRPENLTPVPQEEALQFKKGRQQPEWLWRIRDILALCSQFTDGTLRYSLLGLELQSTQELLMLIRVHIYNLLSYAAQLRQKPVSELPKGYLLVPVVTLTVNLSGSPWNLPTSLSEYFGNDPVLMSSPLWKFICNYNLHIIDPYTMDDNSLLMLLTENRTVLHLLRRSNDRNLLDIPPEFLPPNGRLSEEGSAFLGEMLQIDLSAGKEKEGYNMCVGMDLLKKDLMEKGRQEGIQQGMQKGIQQGRNELIACMLSRQISPNQIHQMTNIPLAQILDVEAKVGFCLGK